MTIHGETEAKPYADSLEFKKSNHTGPYCVECLCCCCTAPLCCTYNFFLPLSETFLCFGPCLPVPVLIVSCERDVNKFVCCYCFPGNENRKGVCVRSQLMLIDEERGTLAFYCPSSAEEGRADDILHVERLNAKPCCIFKRIF